jgi:hypothetical protein
MNKNKINYILAAALILAVGYIFGSSSGKVALGISPGLNKAERISVSGAFTISASTSTTVLSANSGRVWVEFTNDSSNKVYCKYGSAVTSSTSSFVLTTLGSSRKMDESDYWAGIITCISPSGASNIVVSEGEG